MTALYYVQAIAYCNFIIYMYMLSLFISHEVDVLPNQDKNKSVWMLSFYAACYKL